MFAVIARVPAPFRIRVTTKATGVGAAHAHGTITGTGKVIGGAAPGTEKRQASIDVAQDPNVRRGSGHR